MKAYLHLSHTYTNNMTCSTSLVLHRVPCQDHDALSWWSCTVRTRPVPGPQVLVSYSTLPTPRLQDPCGVNIAYHSDRVTSTWKTATRNNIQCQDHGLISWEPTWLCEERVRTYRNNDNPGSLHCREIRFSVDELFLSWKAALKHSLLTQQNFAPE